MVENPVEINGKLIEEVYKVKKTCLDYQLSIDIQIYIVKNIFDRTTWPA